VAKKLRSNKIRAIRAIRGKIPLRCNKSVFISVFAKQISVISVQKVNPKQKK
jgi:hypothetical protein